MTTIEKEKDPYVSIIKFLEEHKLLDSDKGKGLHTHTAFGPPYGSFRIVDNDITIFNNMYKKVIEAGKVMHITEKQKDVGPFLLDLDFNLSEKHDERLYTETDIEFVVKKVIEIFNKYHTLPKKYVEVVVTEKDEPTLKEEKNGKKHYKDGFHIIIPQPIKAEIRCTMIEDLKNMAEEEEWFNNIPYTNPLDDVFDKAVAYRNGWMMYRSKKVDGNMYDITKIYDGNMKKLNVNKYSIDELPILLSVRQYETEDALDIRDEYKTKKEQDRIDKIASIYNYKKLKPEKEKISKETIKKIIEDDMIDISDTEDDTDKKNNKKDNKINIEIAEIHRPYDNDIVGLAQKLIKILSPERAENYNSWIQVGWVLYNISETLLPEFDEFSQKSDKYDKGSCEKYWNKMTFRENGLGIATLKWWASLDNKEECKKILCIQANKKIVDKEFGRHVDIALAVKEMYGHFYRCACTQKHTWFEYQGHRWTLVQKGYTLNNRLSDEVAEEFGSIILEYMTNLKNTGGIKAEMMAEKTKLIYGLIKNLKTTSFKSSVMEECSRRFYDSKFEEKINENTKLIGFNNGVYDLQNQCFRDGAPDDLLTFNVGYDYNNFTINSPEVQEVYNFFKTVQPQEDMCEYILTYIASTLDGENEDQNFIIWTGAGSNGKSTIIDLVQNAFGDYFGTVPITLLTQKRGSSSSATPELADKAGKRLLVMNETEHDDVIRVGYMKELTGGDLIQARALYGSVFYYRPQFNILVLCNTLPNIPSTDKGTWRRVRKVPFPVEFVSGPCTKPHQKPKDKSLKGRMKTWNKPFMWLLLNKYYKIYKEKGLDKMEPQIVKDATAEYQKDTDIHYEFFSENFTRTSNEKDSEPFQVIFATFKDWLKEYHDNKSASKKDLIKWFKEQDIKISNNNAKIHGIKFIDKNNNEIE